MFSFSFLTPLFMCTVHSVSAFLPHDDSLLNFTGCTCQAYSNIDHPFFTVYVCYLPSCQSSTIFCNRLVRCLLNFGTGHIRTQSPRTGYSSSPCFLVRQAMVSVFDGVSMNM